MREALEFVTVGENEYRVVKVGRAQAEQVVRLTQWITKHGAKAFTGIQGISEGDTAAQTGMTILGNFIETLDADALVDLFYAAVGCTKEEAELYFDIAILIDVVLEIYERQPAVRRLIDRFFSQAASIATTEK